MLFHLFDKPPVSGVSFDGFADTLDQSGRIQRTVQKRVDIARLVGSRKQIVHPPQVDSGIVPSGKMFIAIVRLRHRIDVAVGKLHCGKPFPFRLRQILIQPRLPDQLGELAFGQVLFPHGRHPLYMAFGIVRQKQTQGRIEQILHAHGSQFVLISVRRDAKVTADQPLRLRRKDSGGFPRSPRKRTVSRNRTSSARSRSSCPIRAVGRRVCGSLRGSSP